MGPAYAAATRPYALYLYRSIWRAAMLMPTKNRVVFVRKKLRKEFDANIQIVDPARLDLLLRTADTHLENVRHHAAELRKAYEDPTYNG
ncbi:unnamed protein product [Phaeothamnion confervicola]